MERLAADRRSFRLARIDVENWNSPVCQQFQIRQLPTLHLYDGRSLVSDDTSEVLRILQQ